MNQSNLTQHCAVIAVYLWQVPMIAAKITQEEKDSTRVTVDEDRKHAIEAAIVRDGLDPTHIILPEYYGDFPNA